ncbi:MAG: 3-dehydroquinate synthase [Chloroflexaceae bacterium]|nr:3-dehydroquinate synthase [Chloroflexaceae bacterium]
MTPEPDELVLTTATARYAVVVGPGLHATLPERLTRLGLHGTLWLISDREVFPHHGPNLEAALSHAGFLVRTYLVPSGEASKSQGPLWQIYAWMIGSHVERGDVVLALGGGVVGDLAGFAAATILRGIAVVQLPTTLLAMVDAALGGKTGINHPLGKNLIGAFHQPRLVLADTQTLRTLPPRELRAGWAEVIKHGVIRDASLFETLEAHAAEFAAPERLQDPSPDYHQRLGDVIRQAAAVKVAVVSDDEREQGLRVILNYGHTLGHALETASGYGALLHGEAVAIGMHAAARMAAEMKLLAWDNVERQRRLLEAYGLPTAFPPGCDPDQILSLTLHDKKVLHQRIRWILPTAIGQVTVRDDVPDEVVRAVLTSP